MGNAGSAAPYRAADVLMSRATARTAAAWCRHAYQVAERAWVEEEREALLFEAERAMFGC